MPGKLRLMPSRMPKGCQWPTRLCPLPQRSTCGSACLHHARLDVRVLQEMPIAQKVMIWLGICLDVFSKAALLVEIVRLAQEKHWGYFALVLLFFAVSGAVVTVYWLTHYPSGIAERLVTAKPRPGDGSAASWLSGELLLVCRLHSNPLRLQYCTSL